jgi:hypothetical protein
MIFQDFFAGLLLFLVGTAFCFVGYRFFQVLIALWGFFAGFNLGATSMVALFGGGFLGTVSGWILGLVIGLILAVIAYFFYYIAVMLLAATVGYIFGSGLMAVIGFYNPGFLAVAVGFFFAVLAVVLVLAFNLPRLLIMALTALGGAEAMVAGFLLLLGRIHTTDLQYSIAVATIKASWFWSVVWIAVAVVGFAVQWRARQNYTLEWSRPIPSS